MKKLLFALTLLAASPAWAADYTEPYGAELKIGFCLHTKDDDVGARFNSTATHASGDTFLTKNEGAEANTTNAWVDEGACYSITLTATEMQAARINLMIRDQDDPPVWADKNITIETYGNASAQHADAPSKATIDAGFSAIPTQVGTALATYDPPTKAELDSGFAGVPTQVTTALGTYDGPTKTEMDSAFTQIKGAGWSSSTDTLEQIRDNAGGGGSISATRKY